MNAKSRKNLAHSDRVTFYYLAAQGIATIGFDQDLSDTKRIISKGSLRRDDIAVRRDLEKAWRETKSELEHVA